MKMIKDLDATKFERGLCKKGHAISKVKYNLVRDYLEKINYAIIDMRHELNESCSNSVLICLIAYVCWIQESVNGLKLCYKPYVFKDFVFDNVLIDKNTSFLKAIRSFVLAHPFTTNRHSFYGFDGTLRCVDIQPNGPYLFLPFDDNDDRYYIDVNGCTTYNNQDVDYWLYIYNDKKYENQYHQYIGISVDTICDVANCYIDYLHALNKHMRKLTIQKGTK